MKLLYTWPQNSATGYFNPDHYGDATYGVFKKITEARNSTWLTQLNPSNPGGVSDEFFVQLQGMFMQYQLDNSLNGNISRYDLWRNPLVVTWVNYVQSAYPQAGWVLENPADNFVFDQTTDPVSTEVVLRMANGQPHGFRNGQNIYFSFGGYLSAPTYIDNQQQRHAIVEVLDSTRVKLWRHADYNDDGTVDTFFNPYRNRDIWGVRNYNNGTLYDSRPFVYQANISSALLSGRNKHDERLNSQTELNFSSDWRDDVTATLPVPLFKAYSFEYAGFDNYTEMFANIFTDDYMLLSDELQWGMLNTGDLALAYTPTNDVTVSANGTEFPQFNPEYALFTKTNHGLNNGDIVNVTEIDGFQLYRGDDVDQQVLPDGGTTTAYWVDRLDDNRFFLTLEPYDIRRPTTYLRASSTTGRWDWTGAVSASITPGECDVRKAQTITDTTFRDWRFPDWNGYRYMINTLSPLNYDIEFRDPTGNWGTELLDAVMNFGPSGRDSLPYTVDNLYTPHYGNKTYSYRNSSGTLIKENAAQVKPDYYYPEGQVLRHKNTIASPADPQYVVALDLTQSGTPSTPPMAEILPELAVTTDANGYLSGVSVTSTGYMNDRNHYAWIIENKPSEALDPVPVTAANYSEDIWDTADEWTTTTDDPDRVWPDHVRPRSIKVTVAQPGSVNLSQGGVKYVRNSGVVKYQLEVEYPPLTEEQFAPFMAAAQAARGQYRPFYFKLRYNKQGYSNLQHGILFQKPDEPDSDYSNITVVDVDASRKVITVDGLGANLTRGVRAGQHFSGDSNRNGGLNTIIQDQETNIYGESKFRIAYPARTIAVGQQINLSPEAAIVTLAEDSLEYATDYQGFYELKIIMDLDEFK